MTKKINKTDKTLTRQTKKKRKDSNTKIKNESGDITTNSTEIKKIIREYQNNCTPTNWITQMKWTNSQKHKTYQD